MFYVYELQYPDGTPFYVGKGKGSRCLRHFNSNQKNKLKSNIIKKILANGDTPIIKKVAENLTESVSFEIEKFLIAFYGRRNLETGILSNLTDGGEGVSGLSHSRQTKEIISLRQIGRMVNEETRRKMSVSHTGKACSDHMRTKMSELKKNNKNFLGKAHSITTREKISATHKILNTQTARKLLIKKIHDLQKIEVCQFSSDGNLLNIYASIREAEELTGILATNIVKCCKAKRKTSGGYIWAYKCFCFINTEIEAR